MQTFNPYLPLNEYIPDGEPHAFGDRLYIYGSHDRADGTTYCQDHYKVYSAPLSDLGAWTSPGTSYYRTQDPSNAADKLQLWAPDAAQGPDGRYYLYYCYSFLTEIGVAVSDNPDGPFAFYGHVHYPESINGGKNVTEFMPFDPAVLVDDDGRVYLYYGFAPAGPKEMKLDLENEVLQKQMAEMDDESRAAFLKKLEARSKMEFSEYSRVVELEQDMLTAKYVPKELIPGGHHTAGTGFEGHGFFEATSIRKFNGRYYFVYSSEQSHELCYATSDAPDRGFKYGGTIISNGDIGVDGRTQPVYTIGNNHGGLVQVGDDYYIFYHRQTNGTEFSRQGCAEKVTLAPDGSIAQVEMTSCGLNGGALRPTGSYPASICCHMTDPTTLDHINYQNPITHRQIRITQERYEQYITAIVDGAIVGYKYFAFEGVELTLSLEVRGDFTGEVAAAHDIAGAERIGGAQVQKPVGADWNIISLTISPAAGDRPLYLSFHGKDTLDLKRIAFSGANISATPTTNY